MDSTQTVRRSGYLDGSGCTPYVAFGAGNYTLKTNTQLGRGGARFDVCTKLFGIQSIWEYSTAFTNSGGFGYTTVPVVNPIQNANTNVSAVASDMLRAPDNGIGALLAGRRFPGSNPSVSVAPKCYDGRRRRIRGPPPATAARPEKNTGGPRSSGKKKRRSWMCRSGEEDPGIRGHRRQNLFGATGNEGHLLDALLSLPMVLPPTVLGYYLLVALGRRSVIGQAFEALTGSSIVFTTTGAIIAATLGALPLVAKTAHAAFEAVDPNLVDAPLARWVPAPCAPCSPSGSPWHRPASSQA